MATTSTFSLRRLIQARLMGQEIDANGQPCPPPDNPSTNDPAKQLEPTHNQVSPPVGASSFFEHDDEEEEDKAPIKRRLEGWLAVKLKLYADECTNAQNSEQVSRGPSPAPPKTAEQPPQPHSVTEEAALGRRRSVSATLRRMSRESMRMSRESLTNTSKRMSFDSNSSRSKRGSIDSSSPRSRGVSLDESSPTNRRCESPTSVRGRPRSFLPQMSSFMSESDLRPATSEAHTTLVEASDESADEREHKVARKSITNGNMKAAESADNLLGRERSLEANKKVIKALEKARESYRASPSGDWSENVRQLIKETDLAFMSVGESLDKISKPLDLAASLDAPSKLDLSLNFPAQQNQPQLPPRSQPQAQSQAQATSQSSTDAQPQTQTIKSMLYPTEPTRGRSLDGTEAKQVAKDDRPSENLRTRNLPQGLDDGKKMERRRSRSVPPLNAIKSPPPTIVLPDGRRPSEDVGPMNERRPSEFQRAANAGSQGLEPQLPPRPRKASDASKPAGMLTSSEFIKRSNSMQPAESSQDGSKTPTARKPSEARKLASANTTKPLESRKKSNAAPPPPPRKESKTPKKKSHKKGGSSSKASRWGLSEGVTEILTGQRFKKIEVEEMLTPERMAQLKKEREKEHAEERRRNKSLPQVPKTFEDMDLPEVKEKNKWRSSRGSSTSTVDADLASSPPIPPRSSARASSESPRPKEKSKSHQAKGHQRSISDKSLNKLSDPPTGPLDSKFSERNRGDSKSEDKDSSTSESESDDREDADSSDELTGLKTVDLLGPDDDESPPVELPCPSPIPPPTRDLPALPGGKHAKLTDSKRNTLLPVETDEYFYFKSTPYSLTTPGFRHGLICFSKSEMGKGAKTMDDTLDWTAFQMAILGGADYFVHDTVDEEDKKYGEEIKKWYSSLGYEGHGDLVPEDFPSPRTSSTLSTAGSTDGELPISATAEPTSFLWHSPCSQEDSTFDPRTYIGHEGDDDLASQQEQSRRKSSAATKMAMPLVVGDDGDHKDIDEDAAHDTPSMGFNLHDDLGDFLRWEANHAYVGGYYGPA